MSGPEPDLDECVSISMSKHSRTIRCLRYLWRIPLVLWHLCIHLPLVLLLINRWGARVRLPGGERLDHRAIRWWQGGLMRVFGIRIRRVGELVPGGVLFVANHVSWIDIVIMHSQRVMGFVAKREIKRWPLIGWLATRGETLYHQRGNPESLGDVAREMAARLRAGHAVGVFPEGRTRDGREVGPFHARIFMAAVEAGAPVQPVALRYGERGDAQRQVAYRARESFMANLIRLLGEPGRTADVVFLAPIWPHEVQGGRREMAQIARARIMGAMGQSSPSPEEFQHAHPQ